MKKISIIGAALTGNKGAEAMLTTVIYTLRNENPNLVVNIFSDYPKQDQAIINNKKNINIYSSRPISLVTNLFIGSLIFKFAKITNLNFLKILTSKATLALAQSDYLLDVSGVSYIDGREVFLPYNILTNLPAFFMKVPVVKLAQAMGPFTNKFNKIAATRYLLKCKKLFARGKRTEANLKTLYLKRKDQVTLTSDVAFCHQEAYSLTTENPDYINFIKNKLKTLKTQGKTIFAFSPSSVLASKKSFKKHGGYANFCAQIIKKLLDDDYAVIVFPNAARPDAKKGINIFEKIIFKSLGIDPLLRDNDIPVIESIEKKIRPFNKDFSCLFINTNINTTGLKQLLKYCDMTIVSRFHAMIASLSLKIPTFVISWSHKYLEIMEDFEQQEWVIDFKRNNMKTINKKIKTFIQTKNKNIKLIEKHIPNVKKKSFAQFKYLLEN